MGKKKNLSSSQLEFLLPSRRFINHKMLEKDATLNNSNIISFVNDDTGNLIIDITTRIELHDTTNTISKSNEVKNTSNLINGKKIGPSTSLKWNEDHEIFELSNNDICDLERSLSCSFNSLIKRSQDGLCTSKLRKRDPFTDNLQYLVETGTHIIRYGKIKYCNLPEWMKDNEYILSRYRPELKSFSKCVASVLSIHTETINIWTHLLGFMLVFALMVNFFITPFRDYCGNEISTKDKNVFLLFFLPDLFCLGSSTFFPYCNSSFRENLKYMLKTGLPRDSCAHLGIYSCLVILWI